MALSLLFGQASVDHELALLKEMQALRQQDAQAELFYIVPNHIKFESEIKVLARLAELDGRHGAALVTPKVQVFSLSRLSWYYMKNDPLYQQANLSSNGMVMLVQRLLVERADQLEQYAGLLGKQGFIKQFAKQLLELKESGLSWDEVTAMAAALDGQVVLQHKLNDLALIGRALDQELKERNQYLSSELLTALGLFLKTDQIDLSQQHFFINGYSQMTTSERSVVEALIANAGSVTIALPSDDGAASLLQKELVDYDLFYKPKRLAQKLQNFAQSNNISVRAKSITDKREISDTYLALEDFWIKYVQHGIEKVESKQQVPDLEILELSSRYHEVEQMARIIRREVAMGRARYRDYILLTRDLGQYENIIPAVFAKYGLPIFMDLDRPMALHPLVAFIRQLLSLAPNYALTDIMALLKTELLIPVEVNIDDYRAALALTENYALAKNYSGWRWTDARPWQYDYRVTEDDDETVRLRAATQDAQLAMIHEQISTLVKPFLDQLKKATDAREIARLLYAFLIRAGVDKRILAWRDLAIEQGDLWSAQQPEQVWRNLIAILDDFVAVFDHEQIDLAEFNDLLGAAFDNAKYSGIPATMDQVRISESGIVQNKGYRTVMIFGATSANMPATMKQHALLHDSDRVHLQAVLPNEIALQDTVEQTMADEELLIYNAMMIGTKQLIWLYATSDGESAQQASSYILRLKRAFFIESKVLPSLPNFNADAKTVDIWVGSPAASAANALVAARLAQVNHDTLSPAWQALVGLVRKNDSALMERLFAALDYRNQPQKLKNDLVKALFGDNLKTSISRLESYARNPYEFFLKYGLRLNERQVLALTPAEKGTLMHGLLEHSFRGVISRAEPLGKLTQSEVSATVKAALADLLASDDPTYDIFKSTARMKFLTSLLSQTVEQALLSMQRGQTIDGLTQSLAVETGFGLGQQSLKPLVQQLALGDVTVRGKIDRYDQVGQDYLVVVDYKSGNKVFDYNQTLAGLELQLLTYWDAMVKNAQSLANKQMAAAMFWSLSTTVIKAEDLNANAFVDLQRQALASTYEQGKYRGLILNQDDFIEQLAGSDEESSPFSIKRKKSGEFAASADVIDQEERDLLLDFVTAKTASIANQILRGEFPLAPYRQGNKSALQYSEYKAIMRFDAMMGDHYHDLSGSLKKADALAEMQRLIDQVKGAEN